MIVDLQRLRGLIPGNVRFMMIDRGQGRVGLYCWACGCRVHVPAGREPALVPCGAHELLVRESL